MLKFSFVFTREGRSWSLLSPSLKMKENGVGLWLAFYVGTDAFCMMNFVHLADPKKMPISLFLPCVSDSVVLQLPGEAARSKVPNLRFV
jgi:hypothetical protein